MRQVGAENHVHLVLLGSFNGMWDVQAAPGAGHPFVGCWLLRAAYSEAATRRCFGTSCGAVSQMSIAVLPEKVKASTSLWRHSSG